MRFFIQNLLFFLVPILHPFVGFWNRLSVGKCYRCPRYFFLNRMWKYSRVLLVRYDIFESMFTSLNSSANKKARKLSFPRLFTNRKSALWWAATVCHEIIVGMYVLTWSDSNINHIDVRKQFFFVEGEKLAHAVF